ncbi:putative transcription factor, MBF1 like protein [Brevibacillus sp. CF112]|uniref:helix-turn-helix domain-containing protein n=1 Tax=Brevibacillus TaxID=55080 RepID=UPI000271D534|nr:helix-turn-helix transcriptional regulator [Brevibacillus sp. CF112]EJL40752.1 putative transcription factor, MBF1 like protein [Brevibacillus sp. CF112]
MLAEKLTELRNKRKWTQQEIADKLEISRATYAQYETGRRTPDIDTLKRIARLHKISLDALLGNETELTADEKAFLEHSQTLSFEELIEKYDLTVDGKKASKEEILDMVAFIKAKRILNNDQK